MRSDAARRGFRPSHYRTAPIEIFDQEIQNQPGHAREITQLVFIDEVEDVVIDDGIDGNATPRFTPMEPGRSTSSAIDL